MSRIIGRPVWVDLRGGLRGATRLAEALARARRWCASRKPIELYMNSWMSASTASPRASRVLSHSGSWNRIREALGRGYKLVLALAFPVLRPLEEFRKLRSILAHFRRWDAAVLFVLRLVAKSSFLMKALRLFGRRTLTVHTKGHRALSLRPFSNDIFIFHEVWEDENYLVDEVAAAAEEGVVVDIGAHIGFFSLFAIDVLKAKRVVALEPSRENFLLLRQNTSEDSLSVEAFPVAVGEDNEQMPLFLSAQNPGGHSLKADHHQGVELVRSLSPARAFQLAGIRGCDVLKMDCEGSELDILTKMPAALMRSISVLVIEYHLPIYGEEGLDRMRTTLEKNGFVVRIRPTDSRLGMIYAVQSPSSLA